LLRIAVVDDDQIAISRLRECLNHYSEEKGVNFNIKVCQNGIDLLVGYRSDYDIIFLDVDMPDINGFQTARRIRELDECVILVFVTNLAQYAIEGYKYHAADYIVKPLKYHTFALKMHMILKHCQTHQQTSIFVKTKNGEVRLTTDSIYYVEIHQHGILYHTETGNFSGYGTLKKVEEMLPREEFYRCNNCYIVNLKYVNQINDSTVRVRDEELEVSRPRRKGFVEAVHEYYRSRRM